MEGIAIQRLSSSVLIAEAIPANARRSSVLLASCLPWCINNVKYRYNFADGRLLPSTQNPRPRCAWARQRLLSRARQSLLNKANIAIYIRSFITMQPTRSELGHGRAVPAALGLLDRQTGRKAEQGRGTRGIVGRATKGTSPW